MIFILSDDVVRCLALALHCSWHSLSHGGIRERRKETAVREVRRLIPVWPSQSDRAQLLVGRT